jgi:hypothetical protein
MAYFYFDFHDANKQHLRDLVPSLLTQLSTFSDRCCDILLALYLAHDEGENFFYLVFCALVVTRKGSQFPACIYCVCFYSPVIENLEHKSCVLLRKRLRQTRRANVKATRRWHNAWMGPGQTQSRRYLIVRNGTFTPFAPHRRRPSLSPARPWLGTGPPPG